LICAKNAVTHGQLAFFTIIYNRPSQEMAFQI
jgi:hypothetical protein